MLESSDPHPPQQVGSYSILCPCIDLRTKPDHTSAVLQVMVHDLLRDFLNILVYLDTNLLEKGNTILIS